MIDEIQTMASFISILDDTAFATFFSEFYEEILAKFLPIGPIAAFALVFVHLYFDSQKRGMNETKRARADLIWVSVSALSLLILVFSLGYQSSAQKSEPYKALLRDQRADLYFSARKIESDFCPEGYYDDIGEIAETCRSLSELQIAVNSESSGLTNPGKSTRDFRKIIELIGDCSTSDSCSIKEKIDRLLEHEVSAYSITASSLLRLQEDVTTNAIMGILRVFFFHVIAVAAAFRLVRSFHDLRIAKEKEKHLMRG